MELRVQRWRRELKAQKRATIRFETAPGHQMPIDFGDTKVWNVGTNLAWLPTRDFEIGVEVIYARVDQDVRYRNAWQTGSTVFSKSDDNVTGRLRLERNF